MLSVLRKIFSPPETLASVLQLSCSSQTHLEYDAKPREINIHKISVSYTRKTITHTKVVPACPGMRIQTNIF